MDGMFMQPIGWKMEQELSGLMDLIHLLKKTMKEMLVALVTEKTFLWLLRPLPSPGRQYPLGLTRPTFLAGFDHML